MGLRLGEVISPVTAFEMKRRPEQTIAYGVI
jgi:hypothetical protein